MTDMTVAIIGAGVAGLYAAHLLRAAAIPFIVIEARDRLGGRVVTVDEAGQPSHDGFDLGPSWFWPHTQPAIASLVAELGLSAFGQNSDGDVIIERMSRETFQRYRGAGMDQQSMRLVGGTGALVRALATHVPAAQIWLERRVTAMALHADGVALTIRRADSSVEELKVKQVIAALPPRLLDATVTFAPTQEPATARRWRDTPTWMAPHAKFIAVYERAFWCDAGLSGTAQSMVGPMAEIHDASTAAGAGALFGFIGIGAEHRAAMGEASMTRACVEQLVRVFGAEAAAPKATLFKDWAADELTATPADRIMGGHPSAGNGPWVTGPWQDRLALAGSETSPSEPGYLAGAVVAAQRAFKEIVAKLAAAHAPQ
ncbi:MAG: amine oxidase [Acidocella sp. 20-57-95]|nr:MAG: amine oxidase [Acidocella sp. 20-57-95]HQT63717.1 FAD-dependent oxidoreductase [Acidocella sp.]